MLASACLYDRISVSDLPLVIYAAILHLFGSDPLSNIGLRECRAFGDLQIKNMPHRPHQRWGGLISYNTTVLFLILQCTIWVLNLVLLLALSWYPSNEHEIYPAVLGKVTWYALGVALDGSTRAALLLYLPCYDCWWAVRDTAARSAAHSGHSTLFFCCS